MLKYNRFKYFFGAAFFLVLACMYTTGFFYWWVIVLMISIWLIYISVGAFRMRAGIFLTSICSIKSHNENTLLTFDDGPDPEITPQILDTLRGLNAKAIFFCIGNKVEKHPEIVFRIANEGHIVANHTYKHSNFFGFSSTERIKKEIEDTEQSITDITKRSYKLFRPPFGVTNPNIARATKALDYKVIGWNVRSFDTVSRNRLGVLKRIMKNLKSGDIILFHDTVLITPSILKDFILLARNKGFTFEIPSEIYLSKQ